METKRTKHKIKTKKPVFIQKKNTIPRPICIQTAQKTVPIVGVHEKYGLIETYPGCYVKSYLIGDNNYLTAPEEEQNVYYRGWKKVLNSFGSNVEFALSFNNRSINMTDFFESVLIKETGDEFDHLRKQMNTIIVDRMQDGRNGIQKDKYLTVAVHTDKPKKAGEVFRRLDRDIHKSLVKIGSSAKVISLEERLEILFGLYNDSDEHLITKSRVIDEDGRTKEVKSFDYRNMRSMGLEINDLIAPTSFDITPEHIQMGNKYTRTLRVTNLPSQLNDEFINSATDMPFNCLTTMNYKAIPTREADSIVAKNLSLVRDAKTRQLQAGQKQGVYDDSYVQPELLDREAEALALRDDMRQKDEHLFETTLTVTIFADTEEQLEEYTETLITEYKKASVVIEIMTEQGFDVEAHHAFARKVAEEGIVLLKNEDKLLPLAENTKVAVIGDFAKIPRYQGAGSSLVNPTKEPESIVNCMDGSGLQMICYAAGYQRNAKPNPQLISEAVKVAGEAEVVLVFAGLDEVAEAEGLDRSHMKMPDAQNELIAALSEKYDNVIVVLSAGSPVEMPWADKVKAIVHGYLGGQAGASAMLNVLTGKVNPSGRLNETYPLHYEDTPAYAYYPSKERNSEYREGLYVGYRYYTTVGKEGAYPFGYGLSYTTFEYSNIVVSEKEVRFTIKNTGERAGTEIAQLYVSSDSDSVFRPARELKGFARVELAPGEEKEAVIPFDDKTFRFFDVRTNTWEVENGTYCIMIARNANEIELKTNITVEGTVKAGPYNVASFSSYFSGNIANVSDDEFQKLYGKELPNDSWGGEIGINDAFCQFYYAKSGLCRLIYKILTGMLNKALAKGEPNLDILFIYNMPIRGISRMTGGMVNMKMVYGITEIANGHFFKGLGKVISGFIKG